jgi:hypothetical protein
MRRSCTGVTAYSFPFRQIVFNALKRQETFHAKSRSKWASDKKRSLLRGKVGGVGGPIRGAMLRRWTAGGDVVLSSYWKE